MKTLVAALLVAGSPALALAQAPSTPKPAAQPAPPPAAQKPAAKKQPLARSAQKAVEEVTPVDEEADFDLSPAQLEIARQVYVGKMKCELGASVTLTPLKRPGFFMVSTSKGQRFRMHPVESRTGAIRLEDTRRGAVWIQLGNKSMLMSQKLGQRLADECQSPEQVTQAEFLKRNPQPSLLDGHGPMHRQNHGPHHGPGQAPATPGEAVPADSPATPAAPKP